MNATRLPAKTARRRLILLVARSLTEAAALLLLISVWVVGYVSVNPASAAHVERRHR